MRTRISPKNILQLFLLLFARPEECCQKEQYLIAKRAKVNLDTPGFRFPKPGFRFQNQSKSPPFHPESLQATTLRNCLRHELEDLQETISESSSSHEFDRASFLQAIIDNAVLSQHDLYFEEYR